MKNTKDVRVYYEILGDHVHCKVFTHGKNGDLVFGRDEWSFICSTLFANPSVDLRKEGER